VVVGFAAHGVVSGAEAAAANDGNLWDHTVRHRVHHFCARADDAAPLGVFANHEAVHIVEENERNFVLVAVENEARGFFRGFGVMTPPNSTRFLIRAAHLRLHVLLLIATIPTAQPPMRA